MNPAIDELRWKRFPVLSDGFVTLVDAMGTDSSVVQAARVSYGKDVRDIDVPPDDRKLVRFLMRHHHTTPFEMCEVKLLIRMPMDSWRQMIRHRTASVNEYSTRYTEAIDSMDTTAPHAWRLQSTTNKQGSAGFVGADVHGQLMTESERRFHETAREVYQERLANGVAREQARKDLPLSTYTEAYWKIDLHNLFHYLGKRMDGAAQKEIRDYANIIGTEIVAKLFPVCWEAFLDYRLNARTFSAQELAIIVDALSATQYPEEPTTCSGISDKREWKEFLTKIGR